jgi:hypothetical protein
MGGMKFHQPEFTILVNDRKNSQRKGSGTGEKQEFINLWTSLLPFARRSGLRVQTGKLAAG